MPVPKGQKQGLSEVDSGMKLFEALGEHHSYLALVTLTILMEESLEMLVQQTSRLGLQRDASLAVLVEPEVLFVLASYK